ncbi:MAG: rhodanese-like domain-containing protein [Thiohalomonadales bacterium]
MKIITSLLSTLILFTLANSVSYAGDKTSPETVKGATTVNVSQAKALYDKGVLFVDVRKDTDWAAGKIPNAVHIELKKKFSEKTLANKAKKSDPVVFYCNGASCMRSSVATEKAVKWGYTNVSYFRLGFPAWKAEGYASK